MLLGSIVILHVHLFISPYFYVYDISIVKKIMVQLRSLQVSRNIFKKF